MTLGHSLFIIVLTVLNIAGHFFLGRLHDLRDAVMSLVAA